MLNAMFAGSIAQGYACYLNKWRLTAVVLVYGGELGGLMQEAGIPRPYSELERWDKRLWIKFL